MTEDRWGKRARREVWLLLEEIRAISVRRVRQLQEMAGKEPVNASDLGEQIMYLDNLICNATSLASSFQRLEGIFEELYKEQKSCCGHAGDQRFPASEG